MWYFPERVCEELDLAIAKMHLGFGEGRSEDEERGLMKP